MPFVLRGVVLAVMFVVAFRLMHDIGFTPEQGGRPLAEMRRIAAASIDYGWRVPAVKWLMVRGARHRRRRHLRASTRCSRTCSSSTATRTRTRSPGSSAAIVAGAQILGGLAAPRIRAPLQAPHLGAAADRRAAARSRSR